MFQNLFNANVHYFNVVSWNMDIMLHIKTIIGAEFVISYFFNYITSI